MNLLGKIFIVLIFVMSILFMAFAVCVYATHKNWKDEANRLQTELRTAQERTSELTQEKEQYKTILAHERAARTSAYAALTGKLVDSETQLAQIRQQYDQLDQQRSQTVAALTSAQDVLKTLKDDNAQLQDQITQTRGALNSKVEDASRLTDQLNQLQGEIARLEQRNKQSLETIARAKIQLERHGARLEDPLTDIPPVLDGKVAQVSRDRKTVVITVGSDDGLRKAHKMDFYRRDQYLGRGTVAKVVPNRAVVRMDSLEGRDIRSGDSVATRVE